MKRDLFEKYITYNPDLDLEGSGERDLGHQLAEAMMKKNNYNPEKVPKLINKKGLEKNTQKVILSSKEQKRVNLYYINKIKNKYFNNN